MNNKKQNMIIFASNAIFYSVIILILIVRIPYLLIRFLTPLLVLPFTLIGLPIAYIPFLSKHFSDNKKLYKSYIVISICISIVWGVVSYFKGFYYSTRIIFVGITFMYLLMILGYKHQNVESSDVAQINSYKDIKFKIIFFVVLIILAIITAQKEEKTKWSDLSDKEKANAEWAYEVKEYQKEYEKNNKKK